MADALSTQVVVIGAGPGGYACAFRAADLGRDVILIDPEANPGGVCLYRGCIPSKAYLHVAAVLSEARRAEHYGVHFRPATVERVRSFRMTLPLFAVYAGLDVDLAERHLPNTNWWIWGSYDIEGLYEQIENGEMPDEKLAYVTVTSLRDPDSGHIAPEGCTNLQVMTLVPADYALWHVERGPAEGGRYHRDPEYRRRKTALMDELLATAEEVIPDLREHVHWKEAATPVTQERFTHSTGGTSYGIEFATDQMGPMRIGPETDVPGLFLCGASTPSGHGIANVMVSGVRAAEAALETELLSRVLAGELIGDPARLPPLRDDWDAWRESH